MAAEITLTHYYDVPLHCPFCGKPNMQYERASAEIAGCDHLMVMTFSEGIMMAHTRVKDAVKQAGYELNGDGDFFLRVQKPGAGDEDDIDFDDADVVELAQSFKDAVTFCQIVGPPSGAESYTVYAFSDEEYEKFGDKL